MEPFQEAGQAANNLGDSLNRLVLGIAQQRYQQEQNRALMTLRQREMEREDRQAQVRNRLFEAQTTTAEAQGLLDRQKLKDLEEHSSDLSGLQMTVRDLLQDPNNEAVQSTLGGLLARASARPGNDRLVQSISQILQMNNPAMQRIMAAGGADKLYHVTPQGSVSTSLVPGVEPVQGGYTIGPESMRVGPVVGEGAGEIQQLGLPRPATGGLDRWSPNSLLNARADVFNFDRQPDWFRTGVDEGLKRALSTLTNAAPPVVPQPVAPADPGVPVPSGMVGTNAFDRIAESASPSDYSDGRLQEVIRELQRSGGAKPATTNAGESPIGASMTVERVRAPFNPSMTVERVRAYQGKAPAVESGTESNPIPVNNVDEIRAQKPGTWVIYKGVKRRTR